MLEKHPRRSHGFALVLGLSVHLRCSHFHVSFLTECESECSLLRLSCTILAAARPAGPSCEPHSEQGALWHQPVASGADGTQ